MSDFVGWETAWALAEAAHAGQTDKSGAPYIDHLWRVFHGATAVKTVRMSDEQWEAIECAAILHDALEDTDLTEDAMLAAGIPERAISIVKAVTKPKGANYLEWIKGIATSGDVGAIIVKLADNMDNSDEARLALLPADEADRLRKKYAAARQILQVALEDERW